MEKSEHMPSAKKKYKESIIFVKKNDVRQHGYP